jgi:hypothetical protein
MYLDAGGETFGQTSVVAVEAPSREFRIYQPGLSSTQAICVDGYVNGFRCLSHWPGTSAPRELAHELSTGMALRFARLSFEERKRLMGDFSIVTNDHYDTDGVLSAFCLLRPDVAIQYEDLLLRTAAAGDYRTDEGEDALALDLTIWALRDSPSSPLAGELAKISDTDLRSELCYRWLIAHLPELLRDPFSLRSLVDARMKRIARELTLVSEQRGVRISRFPEHDLAVIESDMPLTRQALVFAAGTQYRVLWVVPGRLGFRYRLLYRNETWFLGSRDRLPPRPELSPLAHRLNQLEPSQQKWWAIEADQTSAQLGFGNTSAVDVFGDLPLHEDQESALGIEQVLAEVKATFLLSKSIFHEQLAEDRA